MSNLNVAWDYLGEAFQDSPFKLEVLSNRVEDRDPYCMKITTKKHVPGIKRNDRVYPWQYVIKYFDYGVNSGQFGIYWDRQIKFFNLANPECASEVLDFVSQELRHHLSVINLGALGKGETYKYDRNWWSTWSVSSIRPIGQAINPGLVSKKCNFK